MDDGWHRLFGSVWVAGAAGAAAIAVADWKTPSRLFQHFVVGTLSAGYATPFFFPFIKKALDYAAVDSEAQPLMAAFITGGFAIYAAQYAVALFRRRTRGQK